ncbi:MAG: AAA family ATPase [Alphaproteobacteria bacterium]|nr:AAA family ATPase [Alphaproteobacteria bacterium]
MIIDDQSDLRNALSKPDIYGLKSSRKIIVKETNISVVFLTGEFAYKLKRGVKFPYVDYSSVEKRRMACEKEMDLCNMWAPGFAYRVEPVVRIGKNFKIGTSGKANEEIVDYLFVMKEFPEDMLFDKMTDHGELDRFEMMDTAERIYEMHSKAKIVKSRDPVDIIRGRILENNAMIRCFTPSVFDADDVDALEAAQFTELENVKELLKKRGDEGKIRECHGDLNLRNIAICDGKVTVFNPIEFYDELTNIDILYDFAFLLLDMESKGLRRLSSILFNHYIALSGDTEGVRCLPLFMSCRACVNAYVFAEQSAGLKDKIAANLLANRAYSHLVMARRLLKKEPPILMACGGLSGSGKSRISRESAPYIGNSPGAVILRDDVIRKNILGVGLEDYVPTDTYTKDLEEKVFDTLCEKCKEVLKTGQSVVADALFHDQKQRERIENIAQEAGVKFLGIWGDAPIEIRKERVMKRLRNPSDVKDPKELEEQLNKDVGVVSWDVIDTSGEKMVTLSKVRALLQKL